MTGRAPLRVLVADDSPTARSLLVAVLDADPEVEVVGQAADGAEALAMTKALSPAVVVMDIEMPVMDGFEATKRIMVERPTPIVVVTSRNDTDKVEAALRAVRAGALTLIPKPPSPGAAGFDTHTRRLVTLVKALAEVKVVRQRGDRDLQAPPRPPERSAVRRIEIVGVAASTGGPAALYRFLEVLPRTLDVPVLVVQHIAKGFVGGLAQWLSGAALLPVRAAEDGDELAPNQVYIAPDDQHLEVSRRRIRLSDAVPDGGFRPSANVLFSSLADGYGPAAAGVVLTGMGHDGLHGAARLRDAGGYVLAQDSHSSTVFGMPRAVIDAGLADAVGPVEDLVSSIARFVPMEGM